jgi:hypothetical protein
MSKVIEYHIEVSKINQDTNMSGFQEMKDFVRTICPQPNHWCNGQPIKNQATIKLPPCQCYIPGKGCMHPENPINLMVVYKNKRKKEGLK